MNLEHAFDFAAAARVAGAEPCVAVFSERFT